MTKTTIRCVVCGGLHLNVHEADGRIDQLERELSQLREENGRLRVALKYVVEEVDDAQGEYTKNLGYAMDDARAALAPEPEKEKQT